MPPMYSHKRAVLNLFAGEIGKSDNQLELTKLSYQHKGLILCLMRIISFSGIESSLSAVVSR